MKTQTVTIFVHGTLPPEPVLRIPLVHSFFFCPPGLTKASDLDEKFSSRRIANQLCTTDPEQFNAEHFYLFGWSGYLSAVERKKAATALHNSLMQLVKEYELLEIKAILRVITHSHGGNVALMLKEVAGQEQSGICIDELILLACPVQTQTASSLKSPLFKHVFSIHSHHDLLQVLDPQGIHSFLEHLRTHGLEFTVGNLKELGPLFSSRHFEKVDHLTQLNVKHSHRELLHIEFLLPHFICALPSLIKLMKDHTKTITDQPDDITYIFQS